MALNIFNKNTKKGAAKPKKEAVKSEAKKAALKKEAQAPKTEKRSGNAKGTYALGTVKMPYITEKAVNLTDKNFYVFKVDGSSNKIEIKKAVEDMYKVDVERITIINTPEKKVGRGRTAGMQKGFKKALVRIKDGQKIEVMPK
ncbi:MAG: 50S ribosomal protein L23 [Candidatus Paceibacterota bacterium]|jgi:large subunit ribosomal protein L23